MKKIKVIHIVIFEINFSSHLMEFEMIEMFPEIKSLQCERTEIGAGLGELYSCGKCEGGFKRIKLIFQCLCSE